jgi:hypothetical protein
MPTYSGTTDFSNRPSINLDWTITTTDQPANSRTAVTILLEADPDATNAFTPYGTGNHSITCAKATNPSSSGTWSLDFRSPNTLVTRLVVSTTRYIPYGSGTTATIKADVDGGGSTLGSATTGNITIAIFDTPSTTYTATYYANNATSGSTGATSYTSPPSSSGTVASNGFTRTGYYFTGWNTEANGTGTWYYAGNTFTGNINLWAQWQANSYTISYSSNNGSISGSGSTSSSSASYPATSLSTRASGFTAPSGYAFGGWSTSQDNTADYIPTNGPSGFDLSSSSTSVTYYAVWTQTSPIFSNSAITTTGTLARNINTNADFTVAASPVTGYSIVYSGTGLNPTSWLSINSSGQLSGVPPAIGTYTFKIRATNNSFNTDTSEISFVVSPPGFRMTGSSTKTRLASAKRFIGIGQSTTNFQGQTIAADADGYVSLTKMAIYKAGIWTDISNVS